VEYQLRDYQIRPGELEQWVEEWKKMVCPLRTSFGFAVVGAWTIEESDRFVWILAWGGPGSFEEADRAYYASAERFDMNPDPARHLLRTEKMMLRPVLATP
jgi:NIPSNAP protein